MTETEIQLLVIHKTAVLPLDMVAEKYLHLTPAEARRRAALNQLPFPTFKLGESRKSPPLVRVSDLAASIDDRVAEAAAEYVKSQI